MQRHAGQRPGTVILAEGTFEEVEDDHDISHDA